MPLVRSILTSSQFYLSKLNFYCKKPFYEFTKLISPTLLQIVIMNEEQGVNNTVQIGESAILNSLIGCNFFFFKSIRPQSLIKPDL